MTRSVLIAAGLLCAAIPASAQMPGSKVASVAAAATPAAVTRGGKGLLTITMTVAPEFHVNAHKPNDPALIPTVFAGAPPAGVTFGAVRYPAAKTVKVTYEKQPMLVYTGRSVIQVPYTVSRTAKPGPTVLTGTINYQGCNATSCFPPTATPFRAKVTIK